MPGYKNNIAVAQDAPKSDKTRWFPVTNLRARYAESIQLPMQNKTWLKHVIFAIKGVSIKFV